MGSSETIKWAAGARSVNIHSWSPSADATWWHVISTSIASRHGQYGYEASPDQIGWASPVYVADSDERARAEAKAGIETLFNDFLATPFQMLLPPGYMSLSSMKNTMRLRKALGARARLSIDELIENGTVVVGSPRTVRDQLARLRDETGANKLVTMLQFGVLSDKLTRRNMEMFTSEVMPHLR